MTVRSTAIAVGSTNLCNHISFRGSKILVALTAAQLGYSPFAIGTFYMPVYGHSLDFTGTRCVSWRRPIRSTRSSCACAGMLQSNGDDARLFATRYESAAPRLATRNDQPETFACLASSSR